MDRLKMKIGLITTLLMR